MGRSFAGILLVWSTLLLVGCSVRATAPPPDGGADAADPDVVLEDVTAQDSLVEQPDGRTLDGGPDAAADARDDGASGADHLDASNGDAATDAPDRGPDGGVTPTCTPDVDLGLVAPETGPADFMVDTSAGIDGYQLGCGAGGKARVISFTIAEGLTGFFSFTQTGQHVASLFGAAPGEQCDGGPMGICRRLDNVIRTGSLEPGTYYVIIEASEPGLEGMVSGQLDLYRAPPLELCDNGIDDNGNGLVDCDDPDCFGTQVCS